MSAGRRGVCLINLFVTVRRRGESSLENWGRKSTPRRPSSRCFLREKKEKRHCHYLSFYFSSKRKYRDNVSWKETRSPSSLPVAARKRGNRTIVDCQQPRNPLRTKGNAATLRRRRTLPCFSEKKRGAGSYNTLKFALGVGGKGVRMGVAWPCATSLSSYLPRGGEKERGWIGFFP